MRQKIAEFWKEVRRELRRDLGQESGKRDKKKAIRREELAHELHLSGVTLRSFLNGNQATLGREALFTLLARDPALASRYKEATSKQDGTAEQIDHGLRVQMTLQFEGSEDPPTSLTVRIPAGREGVLTVVIDPRRVA